MRLPNRIHSLAGASKQGSGDSESSFHATCGKHGRRKVVVLAGGFNFAGVPLVWIGRWALLPCHRVTVHTSKSSFPAPPPGTCLPSFPSSAPFVFCQPDLGCLFIPFSLPLSCRAIFTRKTIVFYGSWSFFSGFGLFDIL